MKKLIPFILLILFIQSCISIARIEDFPPSSTYIYFDNYAKEKRNEKEPFWTFKGSNEYFIEKELFIENDKMIDLISKALDNEGYRIFEVNQDGQYVLGKRGIRANEWNTKTGVYFKTDKINNKVQIYIVSKITQDITGGIGSNRALKVANALEDLFKNMYK